jgi:hypothetical protein
MDRRNIKPTNCCDGWRCRSGLRRGVAIEDSQLVHVEEVNSAHKSKGTVMKAKIYYQKYIQDSQDFGSNDDHMVSRVFFTLEIGGKKFENLHATIKQTVGSHHSDSYEVSLPEGYNGPMNYNAYRDSVEGYARSFISINGDVSGRNIQMRNNQFVRPAEDEFEIT